MIWKNLVYIGFDASQGFKHPLGSWKVYPDWGWGLLYRNMYGNFPCNNALLYFHIKEYYSTEKLSKPEQYIPIGINQKIKLSIGNFNHIYRIWFFREKN
jgi:hypothetical protein